jgi:hypothetical protein
MSRLAIARQSTMESTCKTAVDSRPIPGDHVCVVSRKRSRSWQPRRRGPVDPRVRPATPGRPSHGCWCRSSPVHEGGEQAEPSPGTRGGVPERSAVSLGSGAHGKGVGGVKDAKADASGGPSRGGRRAVVGARCCVVAGCPAAWRDVRQRGPGLGSAGLAPRTQRPRTPSHVRQRGPGLGSAGRATRAQRTDCRVLRVRCARHSAFKESSPWPPNQPQRIISKKSNGW